MKTIKCNAIISGIRAKVDRSLGLSISTPELSNDEKVLFMEMQGINVDLTITPLDSEPSGLEKIDTDLETKTSSQRLRGVLFVYWKQLGEKEKFEDFYRTYMEKMIDFVKGKLEQ